MGSVESELLQSLNKLGHTAADVAQTLENKGIKGTCELPEKCAIAQYLLEQFPGYVFSVCQSFITIWPVDGKGVVLKGSNRLVSTVPEPVATFITQFDANKYPNLIKESA